MTKIDWVKIPHGKFFMGLSGKQIADIRTKVRTEAEIDKLNDHQRALVERVVEKFQLWRKNQLHLDYKTGSGWNLPPEENEIATDENFKRIIQVDAFLQHEGPQRALGYVQFLYDGYRMAYEDFLSVDKNKRVLVNFEKLIKDPQTEVSNIMETMSYDEIKFKDKQYSSKVEWEGRTMFIDCKEEDRARINTGKIEDSKAETYKLLPKEFIKRILGMGEIMMFEERMGTDVDSVREFVS